tara:strand:+ start:1063 stop:1920 length:858 start_codon:yes stop_codon:yes gene_type:complete
VKKFKNIVITCNSFDKEVQEIIDQCCEVLENVNVNIVSVINLSAKKNKKNNLKEVSSKSDLIISIGGDGTMLSCSRDLGYFGVPILGINLGNLGFLTDIAPEEITSRLIEVVKGSYTKEKRSFLEVSINTKENNFLALNEAVIHSGAVAKMIGYELLIDNDFVFRQKADGLIISSPTGSTAYSLSGGGPIVHPRLKSIILLPMFPHSLNSSPLIIKDDSEISLELVGKNDKAKLSMDSHNLIDLKTGDKITIRKSEKELTLVHPMGHDFFSACRNKLGWSSGITD